MKLARRLVGPEDAEDVVQTVLLRFLATGVDSMRIPRAIPKYLTRAVRGRIYDLREYRNRRPPADVLDHLADPGALEAHERRVLHRELARCLAKLAELQPHLQQTITALYRDGQSYRKAESVLGVGRDAIMKRHRAAIGALKKCLGIRDER